jgi:uncharacterized phiE125 gp8 family phage protein
MLTVIDSHNQTCVSLQQVKAQLRLDHPDDDDYLLHLIKAASKWVEDMIDSPLLMSTFIWMVSISEMESIGISGNRRVLRLPQQNIIDVKKVTVIDRSGHRKLVRHKVQIIDGEACLYVQATHGHLEIEFSAGYGDRPDCVPEPLRQVIITHVACNYEYRTGIDSKDYLSLLRMVQPYRRLRVS